MNDDKHNFLKNNMNSDANIIELYSTPLVRYFEEKDFSKVSYLITKSYESDDLQVGEAILKNSMSMGESNCGIFVYDNGDIQGVMILDTNEVYRNVEIKHVAVEQTENYTKICHYFLDMIIHEMLPNEKYKLYIKVPFADKEKMIFFINEDFIPESCLWDHILPGEHAILFSKNVK